MPEAGTAVPEARTGRAEIKRRRKEAGTGGRVVRGGRVGTGRRVGMGGIVVWEKVVGRSADGTSNFVLVKPTWFCEQLSLVCDVL